MENKTEETQEQIQEAFDSKVKQLHQDFKDLADRHGVTFLAAIYFKEEDLSGVHGYGKRNHVEEQGLAHMVKVKFNS